MDWLNINMDEKPILRIDTEQFFVCTASFNKWIKDEEGRYSLEKVFFNEKQYGGKKIPKVWSNTQFQSGSPQSCSMDSSVVLYGQPSNFLIDRQRDDPTKDKSQSNLGIPLQAEYCPSFILTIIDNGVLNNN